MARLAGVSGVSARHPGQVLRAALARGRARWLWQPDKWERLTTCLQLANPRPGESVADVGGRGDELARLLPGRTVVSVNVEQPCDVLVSPGPLPFADDAFDVVTSTDVLEHLPAGYRAQHLAELVRVTRRRVVVCFPCGGGAKDASERRLGRLLREQFGVRFDFLDEHLQYGLPRVDDTVAAVRLADPSVTVRVELSDGVEDAERLLLDAVRALKGHRPAAVARSAWSWLVRRRPHLTTQRSEGNNRAYMIIDLERPAPR